MPLYGGHPDHLIEVPSGHEIPTVGVLALFSGDERMARGAPGRRHVSDEGSCQDRSVGQPTSNRSTRTS